MSQRKQQHVTGSGPACLAPCNFRNQIPHLGPVFGSGLSPPSSRGLVTLLPSTENRALHAVRGWQFPTGAQSKAVFVCVAGERSQLQGQMLAEAKPS